MKPGQEKFLEDEKDESCTHVISSRIAFNDDLICDVPGYFDSQGRDVIQQAQFVDYIKNKSVRAIVFVYTDRADSFMKHAVQSFKQTSLANNIIFIKNKLLQAAPTDIETFEGCPKLNILAHQRNFDLLKRHISELNAITVTDLVTPISLFKIPLQIVKTEERDEFVETRQIPTTVTLSKTIQVPVEREVWKSKFWGTKKWITEQQDRTTSQQEVVNKPFQVYNRNRYTYAERFDGQVDIYKKEFVRSTTVAL